MLHLCNIRRIHLTQTPHLLLPGLKLIRFQPLTNGFHRYLFHIGQGDPPLGQQGQRPPTPPRWRGAARNRHQQRILIRPRLARLTRTTPFRQRRRQRNPIRDMHAITPVVIKGIMDHKIRTMSIPDAKKMPRAIPINKASTSSLSITTPKSTASHPHRPIYNATSRSRPLSASHVNPVGRQWTHS